MSSILKVIIPLLLCSRLLAASAAEEYYAAVERHLRSLPSLEIGYRAKGPEFPEAGLEGRLAFRRPDGFYHDTPEWTHCEVNGEQWRLLKEQVTLLLEDAEGRAGWTPEVVLLSLNRELSPYDLVSQADGDTLLVLDAASAQVSGQVNMLFAPNRRVPKRIEFVGDEGVTSSYEILMWHEAVTLDSSLFAPPAVPAENVIDFRTK
ncbi:MAG: hypothetical protein IPH10_07040 [bacterium]|nr:hypothetical protein [bacterium]